MSPSARRSVGLGFVALAAAVIAVSIVAALFWRDYVYLGALGEVPAATGIAGVLLLISLSLFRVRWRLPVYFLAGPLILGILLCGVLLIGFTKTSDFVDDVADTDGYSIGRFTVTGFLGPSQIELRARSHDGLLSRDGQPIACFAGDELSDPKWRLAGVRFTGADKVELTMGNADVVTVDIDPITLAARSGKIDRCTDADYPTWSD
jgi:hypothetical protein